MFASARARARPLTLRTGSRAVIAPAAAGLPPWRHVGPLGAGDRAGPAPALRRGGPRPGPAGHQPLQLPRTGPRHRPAAAGAWDPDRDARPGPDAPGPDAALSRHAPGPLH